MMLARFLPLIAVLLCFCSTLVTVSGVAAESAEEKRYQLYEKILSEYVDDKGLVYYEGLKKNRSDLDAFVEILGELSEEEYKSWSEPEQIAFWSNAYNALTLQAIIDNYPIKAGLFSSLAFPKNSIRQIKGVWDDLKFKVLGQERSLNEIEHEILRKQFEEPRIHMALVCAAVSCPRLRNEPYYSDRLNEQFADQAKDFLANKTRFRFKPEDGEVELSKIFDWFGEDFEKKYAWIEGNPGYGDKESATLAYVAEHLPAAEAKKLRSKKFDVGYLDYDWSLNERKNPL